jgi:peptidyl-prolyl cis-trans isomerase C
MKKRSMSIIVGLAMLIGLTSISIAAPTPDSVIAKVNDIDILQAEVDFIFVSLVLPQIQQQLMGQELTEDQKSMLEQNIVNQLIVQKLILEQAFRLNITADEEMLIQQLESAKQFMPEVNEEQLTKLLKDDLTVQQVINDEVVAKQDVSDEEVQSYYDTNAAQYLEPEQVKASHIIVLVEAEASQEDKDAAQKKIADILTKANAGEDFAELAKEFSEGPSKDTGGDLGFFGRGQMVQAFEEAAFAMSVGDISDIVETQFGYHIIKLTDRKEERQIPFEEAEAQIRKTLIDQKVNSSVTAWIEQLRSEATIEIMEAETEPETEPAEETAPETEAKPEEATTTE